MRLVNPNTDTIQLKEIESLPSTCSSALETIATAETYQPPEANTESDQPTTTVSEESEKPKTTITATYDSVPEELLRLRQKSKLKTDTSDFTDELSLVLDDLRDDQWMKIPESHLSVYTVVQYPENHNPTLSLTLQQELDQKAPKEFLNYVHNELTIDEREPLLVDEGQRRKTFQTNWPHERHLSGTKMAQAGFYYLGDTDHVQCVFCRGRLHNWSDNDNPMTEHARLFNFCRFVKGLNCGNREYHKKKLTKEDMCNITAFGIQRSSDEGRNQDEFVDSSPLGICTNRAAVIRYAPDSPRLRTYARWPTSSPVAAEQLCNAGFYYTGFDDQVRCFFCSGGIKGWTGNYIPWEEHARWFPDCSYLLNKKGREYVDEVHDRTPDDKKCARPTATEKRLSKDKERQKSQQQEMKSLCERLGHSTQMIERALDANGRPFDSIRDMVEMLHSLENNSAVQPTGETTSPTTQPTVGPTLDVEGSTKRTAECTICVHKTANFVPANHVGLPCGHLIYCESCKREEFKKSQTHQVKCPFPGCGASVTGVIKIYFA